MALYEQLLELAVLERINGQFERARLLSECARCILLEREGPGAAALRSSCDARES